MTESSPRTRFLTSAPLWLRTHFDRLMKVSSKDWSTNSEGSERPITTAELVNDDDGTIDSQAVSSITRGAGDDSVGHNALHAVFMDIDLNAALIPSTAPGHWHLYFEKHVTWEKYIALLEAMADCGLVEHGYVNATKHRGFATLRYPWTRKGYERANPPPDNPRLDEWLLANMDPPNTTPF